MIFCFVGYVTVYYGISVFVGGLFRSSPSPGVLSVTLVGGGHMTYSTVLYISMCGGRSLLLLGRLLVGPVGQVVGVVGRPAPAVTVLFRVVRVRDDLVALGVLFLSQQLLETDDTGEDESELADDESLEGQQGEGS